MDALLERTEFVWTLSWLAHGCSVGTDGVRLDVIMVGTWVLCGNGRNLSGRYHGWHMGALWERTEFVWTLSWLAHGCSVGTDGICLDVIMVGTWVLCGNGRNLSGRYGRDDVFDRASPRNTVNTKGLEASTLALLLPPRTHERRSVFSCKVHEAPQIPMRSACARRAFKARRYPLTRTYRSLLWQLKPIDPYSGIPLNKKPPGPARAPAGSPRSQPTPRWPRSTSLGLSSLKR